MENGDLRAAVRRFLPLRHPNCTHRVRLHADGRDPTLPAALHVSTPAPFPVGCRLGRVRVGESGCRSRTGGHRPSARDLSPLPPPIDAPRRCCGAV